MMKVRLGRLAGRCALLGCAALLVGSCGGESLGGTKTGTGGGGGVGATTGGTGATTGGTGGVGATTGGTGGVGATTGGTGGVGATTGGTGGVGATTGSGGSSGGGGGDGVGAGGVTGTGGCNAIEQFPPILTIIDATSGEPICDPTFTVELAGDPNQATLSNVFRCNGTPADGCPSFVPDQTLCAFALNGLLISNYTVTITAPGYASLDVPDVSGGQGGCVPYVAPTKLMVGLYPKPADAGAADAP